MSDHVVEIRLSKNGGYNYADWRTGDLGNEGQYGKEVVFRRFGIARNDTFHMRVTSPVKRDLIAAYIMVEGAED
jgi:hypothetical protein